MGLGHTQDPQNVDLGHTITGKSWLDFGCVLPQLELARQIDFLTSILTFFIIPFHTNGTSKSWLHFGSVLPQLELPRLTFCPCDNSKLLQLQNGLVLAFSVCYYSYFCLCSYSISIRIILIHICILHIHFHLVYEYRLQTKYWRRKYNTG